MTCGPADLLESRTPLLSADSESDLTCAKIRVLGSQVRYEDGGSFDAGKGQRRPRPAHSAPLLACMKPVKHLPSQRSSP